MRKVSGCCSSLQGPAACLSGVLPNSLVRLPLPCWHPWVALGMAQGGWDLVISWKQVRGRGKSCGLHLPG